MVLRISTSLIVMIRNELDQYLEKKTVLLNSVAKINRVPWILITSDLASSHL